MCAPWSHGFVRVESAQKVPDLLLVGGSTRLQQGLNLLLHWFARGMCHFVFDSVQKAPDLFLVEESTHLQQGLTLLLHWLVRSRCQFVA